MADDIPRDLPPDADDARPGLQPQVWPTAQKIHDRIAAVERDLAAALGQIAELRLAGNQREVEKRARSAWSYEKLSGYLEARSNKISLTLRRRLAERDGSITYDSTGLGTIEPAEAAALLRFLEKFLGRGE